MSGRWKEKRRGEKEGKKETRARSITGTTNLSELVSSSRTNCQYFYFSKLFFVLEYQKIN